MFATTTLHEFIVVNTVQRVQLMQCTPRCNHLRGSSHSSSLKGWSQTTHKMVSVPSHTAQTQPWMPLEGTVGWWQSWWYDLQSPSTTSPPGTRSPATSGARHNDALDMIVPTAFARVTPSMWVMALRGLGLGIESRYIPCKLAVCCDLDLHQAVLL